MANQAQVRRGDWVLDAFVGTGSLLIPAAFFQGQCFGADIDPRVLQGWGVGQINKSSSYYKADPAHVNAFKPKILLNFEQYGLPPPEVLRMDSTRGRFRESAGLFDCIICDPPYGLRAMSRVQGQKSEVCLLGDPALELKQLEKGEAREKVKASMKL